MRLGDGMILDLLKYPVKADDKVEAIHNESNPDEANQRKLFVAEQTADARRAVDPLQLRRVARNVVVPRYSRRRRTGNDGRKKVVKREGERRRPGADKDDFDERVCEFAGRPPEAERAAKVLELCPPERSGCQNNSPGVRA